MGKNRVVSGTPATAINGILEILMDDEVFEKAADEFGITYDTIKNEMRRNLDFAERLDEIMENCKK
jgi:hypothetical protein